MKKSNFNKNIIVLVLFMFSMIGCDIDRLDTPSLNVTEAELFDEPGDFFRFTVAMYSKLTDYYWPAASDWGGRVLYQYHHLMADDITETQGIWATETFQGITATTGTIQTYYDKLYELIQRANILLEKTDPDVIDASIFTNSAEADWYRGEAYFMRAFGHFRLYLLFGTAPVVNVRITSPDDVHIPLSSGVELLDQAIEDWEAAAALLPASWSDEYVGRATDASANGFLMRAYMLRGDYTGNTADYSSVLTAFGRISGRSLVANYLHNFSVFHENNSESIFEFQASMAPNVDNIWLWNDGDNGSAQWGVVESMGTTWRFYGTTTNNSYGRQPWRITDKVLNAFGTDPRIDSLVTGANIFLKYGREDLDVRSGTALGTTNNNNTNSSLNNPRIMRYSECLLLAAEATLLSGGTVANAIGYVNQVRARADAWANGGGAAVPPLSTALSADAAMNAVQNERLVELCGEEFVRWTDIKRWHARGDADYDLSTWSGNDAGFSTMTGNFNFNYPSNLLWPIPQGEIDRNNAINSNNPGY